MVTAKAAPCYKLDQSLLLLVMNMSALEEDEEDEDELQEDYDLTNEDLDMIMNSLRTGVEITRNRSKRNTPGENKSISQTIQLDKIADESMEDAEQIKQGKHSMC